MVSDELVRVILIVSIVILTIFWSILTFVKSVKRIPSLPPGPHGLPIVGYLPFLGINLHLKFTDLSHRYGSIYKLWLGNKLYVILSSTSLVKEVVREQDTNFANRDPPIAALVLTYGGLDIAWSSYGSYWRTMRKIFVREMLGNTNLEACYGLRKDEVRKTIRTLYTKIGTVVDIGAITFATELNVVLNMLWGSTLKGKETSNGDAQFREVISKIVELLGKPNISDFLPAIARFDIQGVERQMKRLSKCVDRIFDSVIDERMKMRSTSEMERELVNEGKKDFLQILLELKETGTPMTLSEIKAVLLDIVVGGTDTTTTMGEWVMAELMHNPQVMQKIQKELADVVGMNSIVEESHLPKLHYLDAVVKETFRLHPPLPLLVPRCPSQSCIVGGYTIPKGTRVLLNVWAIHRDPQVWDNPSEFKPERFLSNSNKWDYTGNSFQYIPFGSGRRVCAGIVLGEKMLMYVLASLLHSFEWQLPKGDQEVDLSDQFGFVMKKKTPLVVVPTQRLPNLDLYM